jgi:DNA-binding FadR family transcriptional regulator
MTDLTEYASLLPGDDGLQAEAEGKLASRVAQLIERDIIGAGWPVGMSLGSEPELAERYSVGRTVLREAIRLIEHRKVAVMRMGPGGGLTVLEPDVDGIVVAAGVFLDFQHATLADIFQAWSVVEPLGAGLAARNGSEEAIRELREAFAGEISGDSAAEASGNIAGLARRISRASGNRVVELIFDVLLHLTARYATYPSLADLADHSLIETALSLQSGLGDVVDAVAAGDSAAATYASRHLLSIAEPWVRPRPPVSALQRVAGHQKLAEVVAGQIYDQILADGWPVGAVLGSEADLIATHGVSRATLREAVRLLEHHRIALMRRGRGGGLIVTAPDQQACADAAAVYLASGGTDADMIHTIWRAIDLACLDLCVERGPQALVPLREALEQESQHPAAGLETFSRGLHVAVADTCGNPVLGLLSHVLSRAYLRQVGFLISPTKRTRVVDGMVDTHSAIVEAIEAGEADVARRRLARHLDEIHSRLAERI